MNSFWFDSWVSCVSHHIRNYFLFPSFFSCIFYCILLWYCRGNFDDYENINLINDSNYSTVIEEHRTVLLQNFRGKNKRVGGCPPSPQNTTTSAVSSRYLPLQDNALILTRSQIAHDSELCGYVFCTSSHHPNLNYTTVSVEGFSPSVSQAIGIDRVELKLYWNNDVHDNLVSTKIPNKDIPLGYIDTGVVVGTVLRDQVHGTMPVFVYYNKERHDHLTCASKSSLSYAKNNNYIRVHNEPIGFVYATPEWSESMYWIESNKKKGGTGRKTVRSNVLEYSI